MGSSKIKPAVIGWALAQFVAASSVHAQGVSGQGTWETTLQGRDLDGNTTNGFEAYYDTALNITWLADSNYAKTSGYTSVSNGGKPGGLVEVITPNDGVIYSVEYNSNGKRTDGAMGWDAAMTWAANLNVYGVTGWRLPNMVDTGAPGCNMADRGTDCGFNPNTSISEFAHLYYETLGNVAYVDIDGYISSRFFLQLNNSGPFVNLSRGGYWFGIEDASDSHLAWYFAYTTGLQSTAGKGASFYAWAVHPGDVAAVPEPDVYALTLTGLAVAGLVARRGRA